MNKPIQPHPQNADGPFYVEYGCCTSCEVPLGVAPEHFAFAPDNHCYVCRQPSTDDETTSMILTAWHAEFGCIRYRGSDPDVLRRLAELDLRDACDVQPPQDIKPIIRNHATFTVSDDPAVTAPEELAEWLSKYLKSLNTDLTKYKTRGVRTWRSAATLEVSWCNPYYYQIVFSAVADTANEWHLHFPLGHKPGYHGVGNMLSHWLLRCPHVFSNIRWYTDADWKGAKIGQATRI